MITTTPLPRLVFGPGALAALPAELAALGVARPLLMSDRGLERAGAVAAALRAIPGAHAFLDVPENPTLAAADAAFAAYRQGGCDGVVALGGGSVLDTAKFVAALAGGAPDSAALAGGAPDSAALAGGSPNSAGESPNSAGGSLADAAALHGRPDRIGRVVPLAAIPTTLGTGSESSPVAALHADPRAMAVGTRSPHLVPRLAICDPDLARTLPHRLVAATGIDALSHCLEGFFAEPANPVIDALALDGLARVAASIAAACEPDGDEARASLMAAAFAGGAAIHKGLGPAHAVALACGDQDLHHGVLIAAALPLTFALVAPHAPAKAARIAAAMGLPSADAVPGALRALAGSLGLPASYREAGYRPAALGPLVDAMAASPFNRASPYAPSRDEYQHVLGTLMA